MPLLAPRQRLVTILAALGYTADETAEMMGVKIETVKTHKRRVIQILGARNMAHAVFFALKNQEIDFNPLMRPKLRREDG